MAPMELTVLRLLDDLNVHFADRRNVQLRCVVLDDLQFGGSPTVRDRILGLLYGQAAIEEFLSTVNAQEVEKRGNLNLLAIDDPSFMTCNCLPRQEVDLLFRGKEVRGGGLDALPLLRQSRATVTGFRPWATL